MPYIINRRRRVCWCLAILCAASAANGAVPISGPGVLFSPFYFRNPEEAHQRHQPSGRGNSLTGLLGPLRWTNAPGGISGSVVVVQPDASYAPKDDVEFVLASQEEEYLAIQNSGSLPSLAIPTPLPPPPEPPESILPPTPNTPLGDQAKGLADEEKLGEEPDEPRQQFLRSATVLLEPGELQVDVGVIYSLQEADFPAVVTVGSDDLVLEGELDQRQLFVPLEFRLGITRRVQGFLSIPVGWSHTEFAIAGTLDEEESYGGLGDISLGATFLLFDGGGHGTDVVFTFTGTLPTSGDSPYLAGSTGFGETSLGDNLYALSGDLLWINNYDPLVVFYGVGYRHQFDRTFDGIGVNPGEEIRLQLGVGFAVNRVVTLSTRFAASFITRDSFDGSTFEGSYREPMTLRFAATVLDGCSIVEPFVELGTTDDATSTAFGVVWTY